MRLRIVIMEYDVLIWQAWISVLLIVPYQDCTSYEQVPTQGEETRYKKVPYLSKASFRRINTG